ncbi:hypothetical protein ACGFNP_54885 [Nonomuraea sp. NPDC049269]|uniref:hypothetical protein n=1 Tax=Nonomuraea sp. NPDC049269 TaxID=3364349 RepID=UPI00371398FB
MSSPPPLADRSCPRELVAVAGPTWRSAPEMVVIHAAATIVQAVLPVATTWLTYVQGEDR